MKQTKEERLSLIRKVANKYNKIKKELKSIDTHNINHYTDSEDYAKRYYGHLYNATMKMDKDWDWNMTMHLLPVYYTTTSFRKRKTVNKNASIEKQKTEKLLKKLGYKSGSTWRAPMPDYSTPSYNSMNTMGNAFKKQENTYTGDEIMGIGTMHKSNMVPIRKDSNNAKDLARMRRG